MICNRKELEYSYITLGKMIQSRDHCADETHWDTSTREDIVQSIQMQISKIEAEIFDYLQAERLTLPRQAA